MHNLAIIFFVILFSCWIISHQLKTDLTIAELKEYERASFQNASWVLWVFGLFMWVGYAFRVELIWLTPYPFYFLLTLVLGGFLAIRVSINQAKLPPKFVKWDNILFAMQVVCLIGLITFLDLSS